MRYQTPSRPQSPEYVAAMRWWYALRRKDPAVCRVLRRHHHMTSCARIAAYHAAWVSAA